jgi:hypothetical protein
LSFEHFVSLKARKMAEPLNTVPASREEPITLSSKFGRIAHVLHSFRTKKTESQTELPPVSLEKPEDRKTGNSSDAPAQT